MEPSASSALFNQQIFELNARIEGLKTVVDSICEPEKALVSPEEAEASQIQAHLPSRPRQAEIDERIAAVRQEIKRLELDQDQLWKMVSKDPAGMPFRLQVMTAKGALEVLASRLFPQIENEEGPPAKRQRLKTGKGSSQDVSKAKFDFQTAGPTAAPAADEHHQALIQQDQPIAQRSSKFTAEKPSPELLKSVYWKLGDRFWLQIIDGKFHKYGPTVFDEGRHGGPTEPGFFASLKAGCTFASDHATETPTPRFYKDLNRILCSHFEGGKTQTLVAADKAGCFRDNWGAECVFTLLFDIPMSDEDRKKILIATCLPRNIDDRGAKIFIGEACEELSFKYETHKDWIEEYNTFWKEQVDICKKVKELYPEALSFYDNFLKEIDQRVQEVNDYVRKIAEEIGEREPFVSLTKYPELIKLRYLYQDPSALERITEKLFNRYNEKIKIINQQIPQASSEGEFLSLADRKLEAIAELYQLLEWLHPFYDGQGRTDLVLLSKLLVDEGFSPAILDDPYMSSFSLPTVWVDYLKEGMARWAKEAAQLRP
jgi:hypothetical protein